MACEPYTKFNKVSHIGNTLLSSEIENNMKWFLDWAFLGIGGWSNVTMPTSGAFGGTFDTLRLVNDPSYSNGQVWEGARGLEWTVDSPAPEHTFSRAPMVTDKIYQYD